MSEDAKVEHPGLCMLCQHNGLRKLEAVHTIPEINTAQGKVDNGRVLFFHKIVLGEPFKMENDEPW